MSSTEVHTIVIKVNPHTFLMLLCYILAYIQHILSARDRTTAVFRAEDIGTPSPVLTLIVCNEDKGCCRANVAFWEQEWAHRQIMQRAFFTVLCHF